MRDGSLRAKRSILLQILIVRYTRRAESIMNLNRMFEKFCPGIRNNR